MPKKKTQFVCQSCGHDFPKWMGRCSNCGEWGTIEEISIAAPPPPPVGASKLSVGEAPVRLKDVEGSEVARRETGIGELTASSEAVSLADHLFLS